ncbi:MAG TPA: CPXCG motif-containing cysteine-rich protein [Chthoniobacterales bacterium]
MEFLIEANITCPHCGENFPLQIDTSQPEQTFIEDCTVCCRPINLTVHCEPGVVVDLVSEAL